MKKFIINLRKITGNYKAIWLNKNSLKLVDDKCVHKKSLLNKEEKQPTKF